MIPMIIIYLMCMPLGYVVGKKFVDEKVSEWSSTKDRQTEKSNYAFVPIMCSILLPLGAMVAIYVILGED